MEKELSYNVWLELVKFSWRKIKKVPDEMKNEWMCWVALEQNLGAFEYIPEEVLTKGMCLEVVKQDWEQLKNVPDEMRTEELCLVALEQNPMSIKRVPRSVLTNKMRDKVLRELIDRVEWLESLN